MDPDLNLIVRVYCKRNTQDKEVEIGTGYPIAHGRILVARHVLAEDSEAVDPQKITLTLYRHYQPNGKRTKIEADQIEVAWDGGGTTKWDAVILRCTFPEGFSVSPNILSNHRFRTNVWSSEGFPQTGQLENSREPQELKGTSHQCPKDSKTVQLIVDGGAMSSKGWRGASGAPVFLNDRIAGLITETREAYGGNRIWAIPMFQLLKLPEFRDAAGLPSRTPIDLARFASEIQKQLLSVPKVIDRLENNLKLCLDRLGIIVKPSQQSVGQSAEVTRANVLVRILIDELRFVEALEALTAAIGTCTAESDEKEKQVLFTLLCWFLPARFKLHKSEEVRSLYEEGNIHLIKSETATPLGAEIIMAAAGLRRVMFDHDVKGDCIGSALGHQFWHGQIRPLGRVRGYGGGWLACYPAHAVDCAGAVFDGVARGGAGALGRQGRRRRLQRRAAA